MSNVKSIYISGTMSYDASPLERVGSPPLPSNDNRHDELLRDLGRLQMPGMGVRVEWGNPAPGTPNRHRGTTGMYCYRIVGQEALSFAYLDRLRGLLEGAGTVEIFEVEDIEA
jgi:hypothetical protein